jgi:hypothetical protein
MLLPGVDSADQVDAAGMKCMECGYSYYLFGLLVLKVNRRFIWLTSSNLFA